MTEITEFAEEYLVDPKLGGSKHTLAALVDALGRAKHPAHSQFLLVFGAWHCGTSAEKQEDMCEEWCERACKMLVADEGAEVPAFDVEAWRALDPT